jgi:hypothetical protein
MSNVIKEVGHGLKVAGEEIIKGVEYVGHVADDVIKVITDAKQLAPQFKTELSVLIADAEPIATILAPVIASSGENVALDLAAVGPVLGDIRKLVADFVTFLPVLKQAVADVENDTK